MGFVEDTVILFVKTHVKDHVGVVVVDFILYSIRRSYYLYGIVEITL